MDLRNVREFIRDVSIRVALVIIVLVGVFFGSRQLSRVLRQVFSNESGAQTIATTPAHFYSSEEKKQIAKVLGDFGLIDDNGEMIVPLTVGDGEPTTNVESFIDALIREKVFYIPLADPYELQDTLDETEFVDDHSAFIEEVVVEDNVDFMDATGIDIELNDIILSVSEVDKDGHEIVNMLFDIGFPNFATIVTDITLLSILNNYETHTEFTEDFASYIAGILDEIDLDYTTKSEMDKAITDAINRLDDYYPKSRVDGALAEKMDSINCSVNQSLVGTGIDGKLECRDITDLNTPGSVSGTSVNFITERTLYNVLANNHYTKEQAEEIFDLKKNYTVAGEINTTRETVDGLTIYRLTVSPASFTKIEAMGETMITLANPAALAGGKLVGFDAEYSYLQTSDNTRYLLGASGSHSNFSVDIFQDDILGIVLCITNNSGVELTVTEKEITVYYAK